MIGRINSVKCTVNPALAHAKCPYPGTPTTGGTPIDVSQPTDVAFRKEGKVGATTKKKTKKTVNPDLPRSLGERHGKWGFAVNPGFTYYMVL